MIILSVNNNPLIQSRINECLSTDNPEDEVLSFNNSPEALAAARTRNIDTAILEADMEEMNGLILGQYLKDLNPFTNLIFLSEKKEFAFDAMKIRASGCVLHPVEMDEVKAELHQLRYPPEKIKKRRVFMQTFGNFEIFVDGTPVTFKYSRTKEIVALLVNNRGAQTTNGEIIATLWEDDGDPRVKGSYLSNLRQDLQNTFTKLKINNIILKQRGSMAIAVDMIECDLYDWLEKKNDSRYRYMGDYMNQYSWSEFMHGELDSLSYDLM